MASCSVFAEPAATRIGSLNLGFLTLKELRSTGVQSIVHMALQMPAPARDQVAGKQVCKSLQATAPKDFAENRRLLLKDFSRSVDPSLLGPATCLVQWGNLHAPDAEVTFTRVSMTIEVRAGQSFELPWGCLELPEVLLPGQSHPSQPCWPITFSVDMAAACILCSMPGGMSREVGSLEEGLKITPSEASFVQAPSQDFLGSLQKLLHTPPRFREPADAKERKAAASKASKEKSQGPEATYTKRVTRSMSVAASNLAAVAKKAVEAAIPARRSRSAPGCPKPPTTPVAKVASPARARGASLQKSASQPQTSPSSQDASKQAEQVQGEQSSVQSRTARSRSPVPAQQAAKAKLPAKAGASPAESLKTAEAGEKIPKQKPQQAKPQQKKDSRATPKSSASLPPPRRRSPSPSMRKQGEKAPEAGAAPPMPDPMPAQQDTTENPKPPASRRARSPVPTPESKQGKDSQKKHKQTNPKSTGKVRTPSTSLPPPRRRSPSPSTQAPNAADTTQQAPTPRAPSKGSDAQDSQQKQDASAKATSSAKVRTPSSSLPPHRRSPSPSTSRQGLAPSGTAPDAGRARRSPVPEEHQQRAEATGDSRAPPKFSSLAEAASAALTRRSPSPAMQRLAEKVAVNSERALRARSRSPLSKWQGAAEETSKTQRPSASPAATLSQLGSTGPSGQPKPQQKPGAKRASGNEAPVPTSRRSPSPAREETEAAKRKRSPLPAAQKVRSDNSDRIVHKGIAALLQATQAMPEAASEKAMEHRCAQPPKRELLSPARSPTPRRSGSVSPRRLQLSDASHVASEAADLGIMHPESLRKLCMERGLSSTGLRTQLISRLLIQSMTKKFEDRESIRSGTTSPTFAPFNALHKSELQAACDRQGLPSSGSCNDLLYRLREQRQQRETTSEKAGPAVTALGGGRPRPARGLSVPPTVQARPVPLSPAPARSFSTPRHRIRSKSPAPAAWTSTPTRRIRGKSLDPARSLARPSDPSTPVPSQSLPRPSPRVLRSRSSLAARGGAMVHSLLTLRPEQLARECKKMCLSPQGSPHAMACRLAAARLETASPGSSATELVSQHSPKSGQLPKPILRQGRSQTPSRQPKAMKATKGTPTSRATPRRPARSQTRSPARSRSHARSLLCALPGAKRSDSPPSTPPRRSAPRSPVPSTGSKLPREMRSPSNKSVGKAGKANSTRSRTPARTTPRRTPHRCGGGCHANTKAGLPCQRSGKIRPAQALFYYCHMHAPLWRVHER
ncbi:Mgrn1 [Symbiodinium sp. CCMP2456]|nr:Mgrn1 [Symbiodinium sp. CCMP2456]